MKNNFLILALFLGHFTFAQAQKIPLKDFFKNPVVSSYILSPDGKTLAYLKPWEGRMNLFIRSTSDLQSEKRVSSSRERDIGNFFWKGAHLFYQKDFGGDENFHLFQIDFKNNSEKDVTPFPKTRVEIIDALKYTSADEMLISHNQRDPKVFDIYKLNIKTGQLKMVLKNPGDYEGYGIDFKGQIRSASRSVGTDTEILYRENNQQKFKPILKFDYTRTFLPSSYFEENGQKKFYAYSNLGRDKIALVVFNPKTQKEEKILYQHTDFDVEFSGGPIIFSEKQKKILGLNLVTWKLEQVFFDTETENIFNQVRDQAGIKNANIYLNSMDDAEDLMIFVVSSDRVRGLYYLYDKKTKKIQFLDSAAPWLKEEDLAEMKPFQTVSRDGLLINGYITLPQNAQNKKLSAVINPHGGPWSRDIWRYNSETQFLAHQGYAVVQMNYRGSTGYGRQFLMASYKQWGLKMQDDITDVTNWLIQQGNVDKKKICIYGGSYGGYATLMGLVKEPDLYACGVDYVGVSNLFTFLKTIPPYWSTFMDKMRVMLGDPELDKDQFVKTSPALNVDRIKAPLFIAQGAKDPRVNKDESDQVVQKLKERGIDVPYLVKENEGHGFRNEENRFEFYEQMEKFFKKYLK